MGIYFEATLTDSLDHYTGGFWEAGAVDCWAVWIGVLLEDLWAERTLVLALQHVTSVFSF